MEVTVMHSNKRMTSREIADLTGKNHFDVMRDIRNLVDQEAITESNFAVSEYKDDSGKMNPMYLLDFEATMVLVTGYDAKRRSLVIKRWMALEKGEAAPALGLHDALLGTPIIDSLINAVADTMTMVNRLVARLDRQDAPLAAGDFSYTGNIADFVEKSCELAPNGVVRKDLLYNLYQDYCLATNTYQESQANFFKLLYRTGLPLRTAKLTEKGVRFPMIRGLIINLELEVH